MKRKENTGVWVNLHHKCLFSSVLWFIVLFWSLRGQVSTFEFVSICVHVCMWPGASASIYDQILPPPNVTHAQLAAGGKDVVWWLHKGLCIHVCVGASFSTWHEICQSFMELHYCSNNHLVSSQSYELKCAAQLVSNCWCLMLFRHFREHLQNC